jgi:hypothetical protein
MNRNSEQENCDRMYNRFVIVIVCMMFRVNGA